MKPGDLILARVQQSDGRLKVRPVLVLAEVPPFGDCLIAAVSSKLHQEVVGLDEIVAVNDADYSTSGLKVSSLIRVGLLATIPKSSGIGILGEVDAGRLTRVKSNLVKFLQHN